MAELPRLSERSSFIPTSSSPPASSSSRRRPTPTRSRIDRDQNPSTMQRKKTAWVFLRRWVAGTRARKFLFLPGNHRPGLDLYEHFLQIDPDASEQRGWPGMLPEIRLELLEKRSISSRMSKTSSRRGR